MRLRLARLRGECSLRSRDLVALRRAGAFVT
jgi:hypothetical protein